MRKWILALVVVGLGAWALGQQVTITFWHAMGRAHGPILETLVNKFMEENPDIKVELVYQGGYGALQQKLVAAVAAGTPPTIAQQYENWTVTWLDALVDLDLFLPEELIADIHPAFIQYFEGRLVTVPFNKSIIVLVYRPDLVSEPPRTWEEFLAVVEGIGKDEEKQLYATGFRPPNPEMFLTFLAQAGGSILSEDWTQVTINNAAGLEAAEFAAKLAPYALVQSGYINEAMRAGADIALWLDSSAGWPYNVSAAQERGVPIAVTTVPCHKTCDSMIQGTNLAIFSLNQSLEQIKAAARLIEFLLRKDNIVYWAKESGYLPVTMSAIESEEWKAYIEESPIAKAATAQLVAGAFQQLLHPRYMDIRNILITYWELLLTGEIGPKEFVDSLAAEIEAIISE